MIRPMILEEWGLFIIILKMNKLLESKQILIYVILGVILLTHGLILSKLLFFPYPELFIYPYLTNHGLTPYSQILDQHFPGLMFLPINFDNLGMNNADIARVWLIAIVILTHLLLFYISSQILKSKRKALLVNFLYLIWQPFFEGWVLWIDSLLPLLLLPAFFALHKNKILLCGLLLGLGVVFKQTLIPLSFLVFIYIFWMRKKSSLRFLLGFLPPILLMILYFVNIGVIKDFWYWTVVFNLTVYAHSGTQIPTSLGFITRVLMVFGFSLFALLHKDKKLIFTLFIFLIGSLVGVFDRANFVHFQPALPFAIMATAIGAYSLTKNKIGLLILCVYSLITIWWQNIFYKGHISSKVFFFDESTYAIASKIEEYTNSGDKIFVFGGAPHLYQMSKTLPAGNIFVFQFSWFLKVAENRILQGLIQDKPQIIVSDRNALIEGVVIKDFAPQVDGYIQQNYEKIDNVGTVDILKRKK